LVTESGCTKTFARTPFTVTTAPPDSCSVGNFLPAPSTNGGTLGDALVVPEAAPVGVPLVDPLDELVSEGLVELDPGVVGDAGVDVQPARPRVRAARTVVVRTRTFIEKNPLIAYPSDRFHGPHDQNRARSAVSDTATERSTG
jgi:hypothetical protein